MLPASAADDAGTLYAAFSLRLGTGTETHLYLLHSADHGVHWSNPVRVDSGGLRFDQADAFVPPSVVP